MVTVMTDKKLIPTICPYCGVGCKFYIARQEGRAVGMEYMPDHPVVGGRLCAKGNAALEVLNHPDRLRRPMKKVNGGFEEISWEEALDMVADHLRDACRTGSADHIGFLASAKCTNEENYLFQKLARMLGTNNVDHCARLCHAPSVITLARSLGNGAMTNPLSDLARSDCIFIIGANPAENHAPAMYWIQEAKDNGARVIVADPRQTPTAWLADDFLRLEPGSDAALLNGMAKVILDEGLEDRDFIARRAADFPAFAASLRDLDLEEVAAVTGLALGRIVGAARAFAGAKTGVIVYCMGITQHTSGSANVAACANLTLLTGAIGKPGAGLMPLRGQNNVQGACDMGALAEVFPGGAPVTDPDVRKALARRWGVAELSDKPGLTVVEMMKAAGRGAIKTMWIMGEDPMVSEPNTSQLGQALDALDFLVVQDIFLTDTARKADLVLPAAAWAEKSGSFTNMERRIQWFDQAVQPRGESRSDLRIIDEVGKRLGLAAGGDDAPAVLAEINETVSTYGGAVLERIREPAGVHHPCPDKSHPGTPILFTERFTTPTGRARFIPVSHAPPREVVSPGRPLVLTTGRLAPHYNGGSMTRRTAALRDQAPACRVEIHPRDAGSLQISGGDSVNVITARGRFTAGVRVTDSIKPGVVFLPFHFPGVNDLTIDALDQEAKTPEYKAAACRVEKGGE